LEYRHLCCPVSDESKPVPHGRQVRNGYIRP
jgi:hypothetical protein